MPRSNSTLRGDPRDVGGIAVHQLHAGREREATFGRPERIAVEVDAQQRDATGRADHRLGVAAFADGAVQIDAPGLDFQGVHDLGRHHGQVGGICHGFRHRECRSLVGGPR